MVVEWEEDFIGFMGIYAGISWRLIVIYSDLMGFNGLYPFGKRLHNYGKIHHAIHGKTHYFYGDFPVHFLYVTRGYHKCPFQKGHIVT